MMDYVDHVTFCSKLKAVLMEQKQWPDICKVQGWWINKTKLGGQNTSMCAVNHSMGTVMFS